MLDNRPELLRFLADRLHNDSITLDVNVIENEDEAPPSTWRTAKVLERMKTDNPAFQDFIDELNLKVE